MPKNDPANGTTLQLLPHVSRIPPALQLLGHHEVADSQLISRPALGGFLVARLGPVMMAMSWLNQLIYGYELLYMADHLWLYMVSNDYMFDTVIYGYYVKLVWFLLLL